MEVSETNDAQPYQAPKENSPASGLLCFLVARGGIEPGLGCIALSTISSFIEESSYD